MGEKLVDSYYIERLHTRIQELEEEVKAKKDGWCICIGENIRLRKALEFYADEENYIEGVDLHDGMHYAEPVIQDRGKRATEALKEGK